MSFKKSSNLSGMHAFLSPSSYSWLGMDEDKLVASYYRKQQTVRGDKLHAYAQQAIELRQPQPENGTTVATYINDAIGYRMEAEVPLYYSADCFGTADSLSCREEKWEDGKFITLRISDLKTGINPADMKQLLIYAALFFWEYRDLFKPEAIRVILRIYQNDAIEELIPDVVLIREIMSKVRFAAKVIAKEREGES